MTRLSVIGTGYLGTTHAVCMAHLGHEVIAFDVDQAKIESLAAGRLPFFEPELERLLNESLDSGKLKFTSNISEVTSFSKIHFLCVGTPQLDDNGTADLSQVKSAAKVLVENIAENSTVIGKSTVPVGTAQWLSDYFDKNSNVEVTVIWNPEFLREGFAVKDTLNPDRIVLGIKKQESNTIAEEIYSSTISTGTPVIVTDYATAELVKVAANAFLATKISFINAFADLCDVTGGDISTLADAIGYDERIGRKFLNAGIGFGGGCLPKDIRALQARAKDLGLENKFSFLTDVDQINVSRKEKILNLVRNEIGDAYGKNIAVLGVTFKPDSDDIRDSPALKIALALAESGADVSIHDPAASALVNLKYPKLRSFETVNDAVTGAQLILHLTEWKQYRDLDPETLNPTVKSRTIIDGRNVLDREKWNNAGWKIIYLGKPSS